MTKATAQQNTVVHTRFSEYDIDLFKSGKHYNLFDKLGSHLETVEGKSGAYFAVWAPNAEKVSVIGDFNGWNKESHELYPRWDHSGIWEAFVPGLAKGDVYKYAILSRATGEWLEKADPFAFYWEIPPRTASVVWDTEFDWKDGNWMRFRKKRNALNQPISVYEVHLESWRRNPDEGMRYLSYKEMKEELVPYVKEMGFTHVEFMPVTEHPFGGSWGYQSLGYFAPTSRFGTPQEFMELVEAFHKENIGVYLDWVPSHFPGDAHGLFRFDGTALYEHEDPRKGFHPDWKSYIFNYGRNEVRSFLISSALFWLDRYHADGLRVDAVASMLYLDYSRNAGEWEPNIHGGRENLEAISLLRELNEASYTQFPDIQMIAEESTSWPMVSRPTYMGGLGFGMKWMMGWMNDSLEYFKKDPIHRKYHHNEITFSLAYAFTENFMLPLSHDEVVHGKGSLLARMPGDEWQRFANLRLLYAWQWLHPGTKLLFMGQEFGQPEEWNHNDSLKWDLLQFAPHQGVSEWVKALNALYQSEAALFAHSFAAEGFEWIDLNNAEQSVIVFRRKGEKAKDDLIAVMNFTPMAYETYRIGVPSGGNWKEMSSSDAKAYFGSGCVNEKSVKAEKIPWQGQEHSIQLRVPPLGVSIWKQTAPKSKAKASSQSKKQ